MEKDTNQVTEQNVKRKNAKRFSKPVAYGLIVLTVIFCVVLAIFLNNKFLTYNETSRYVAQIAHDKKVVSQKPNDPAARVQLGYSYYRNGDNQEAIDQFKTAIQLKKDYFPAFLNLATVYDAMKENNKALENAVKANKLSPKDDRSLLIMGRAYKNLKMYDKASNALEKANEIVPGNSDVIYEIGSVLEKRGNKKDAIGAYKDALKFNPLYKPALDGIKRLEGK